MRSKGVGSSWQRVLGWFNRQRQGSGDKVSAGAPLATGVREQPKTERVAAWEDEGGATAIGATQQAPPADPTR